MASAEESDVEVCGGKLPASAPIKGLVEGDGVIAAPSSHRCATKRNLLANGSVQVGHFERYLKPSPFIC